MAKWMLGNVGAALAGLNIALVCTDSDAAPAVAFALALVVATMGCQE